MMIFCIVCSGCCCAYPFIKLDRLEGRRERTRQDAAGLGAGLFADASDDEDGAGVGVLGVGDEVDDVFATTDFGDSDED